MIVCQGRGPTHRCALPNTGVSFDARPPRAIVAVVAIIATAAAVTIASAAGSPNAV